MEPMSSQNLESVTATKTNIKVTVSSQTMEQSTRSLTSISPIKPKPTTAKPVTGVTPITCERTSQISIKAHERVNFTSENYPSEYESFANCALKMKIVKGSQNFIVCEEIILGYGSYFS